MNLRALLLGAFIGAAAAWYFAVARARRGELSDEYDPDRIWHSIVGDRDVRTDALTERVH